MKITIKSFLVISYFIFFENAKPLFSQIKEVDIGAVFDEKIKPILESKCADCHSQKTKHPFYYKWPLAKKIIDNDVKNGRQRFNINEMISSKENINTGLLKSLQEVLLQESMPPLRYKILHWSSSLTKREKEEFMDWLGKKLKDHTGEQSSIILMNEPIQPIPEKINLDTRKVALGNKLFNDVRLSKNNTISCASCHDIQSGGDDGKVVSAGINGVMGGINAPTVLNSGFNFKQFWDGRVETLEDQIDGPLMNVVEMGSHWPEVIGKLKSDDYYQKEFNLVYQDIISEKNIKDAIATFERSLITPGCSLDQYLLGDKTALSPEEVQGYQLFKNLGCVSCHQGINVGGNMFEKMGAFGDYFKDRGNVGRSDYGRFNVTGDEKDRFKFKVPSLRNVELTAPYFHDGSAETLEKAVQVMAKYQLGRSLSNRELMFIVKFLKTLTGKLNQEGLQ
ncbi:MAG: cytochrome c peroxidase [Elusimicrobiota bacterium]